MADSDSDGVPDGCDLCPGFDDTVDTDGNGVPDGCDCPDNRIQRVFGDIVGTEGTFFGCDATAPQPDLGDILCVLGDFGDGPVPSGCSGGAVAPDFADLVGISTSDCTPDGTIDLQDILGILGAFAGTATCPGPCPCPTP